MNTRAYQDKLGVGFEEYRRWLPARSGDFPVPDRKRDADLLIALHREWDWCWACNWHRQGGRLIGLWDREGRLRKIEVHHIFGGTQGRSDERTNLMPLCAVCHEEVKTNSLPLGRLLYLKWLHDRRHLSWVRLAILRRSFLPDLIPG